MRSRTKTIVTGGLLSIALAVPVFTPVASMAATSTPKDPGTTVVAPYVDVATTPLDTMKANGIDTITAGFAFGPVPGKEPFAAYWGGTQAADAFANSNIQKYIADGGTVIPSFGGEKAGDSGATGIQELGAAGRSPEEMATAEQKVVDETHAKTVDYDIEGGYTSTPSMAPDIQKEAQAAKILQDKNPGLQVTLTLAVEDGGVNDTFLSQATAVISDFTDAGVNPERVNAMAMDYGAWNYDTYGTDLLTDAENVAQGAHDYLATLPMNAGKPDAEIWSQVGITQLIGTQDVTTAGAQYQTLADTPQFTIDQAKQLRAYALDHGLGELSMWSESKDRPAPDGMTWAQYTDPYAGNESQYAWLGRTDGHAEQFTPGSFAKAMLGG